jgi:AcrR family transcriptional regulator
MSERVRRSAPVRARRSHAERTAETCGRVKAAVIESIAEVGYQRTTGAEIARRAGVTWGAVQHHFGDKDGILMAVLAESFQRFAQILAEPPAGALDLEARVGVFIDRAWEHFASAQYRTTFEILLNLPTDEEPAWQADMLTTWNAIWSRYFGESELSQRETLELMHYTISALSGLATTKMLEGPSARIRSRELGFLKDTLLREFSRERKSVGRALAKNGA